MKYTLQFFFILGFIFIINQVSAQTFNTLPHYTKLSEAKAKAKATGKPLFLFVHRNNCGNCRGTWSALKKDYTLQDKLNKEVIFVKVNTDSKDGDEAYWMIRDTGGSFTLPLMGVVDANSGKVYAESTGYKSSKYISQMLTKIGKTSSKTSVPKTKTPQQPKTTPSTTQNSDMAKTMLEAHNKIRAEYGLAPLKWSENLATYAKQWATKLKNDGCKFKHRPRSGQYAQKYGENIAMNWGMNNPSAETFVAQWADEKANFERYFLSPSGKVIRNCCGGSFGDYGHYSQIVWENTTEVGCAIVKCGEKYICVCNYNPSGNMMNQKPFKK